MKMKMNTGGAFIRWWRELRGLKQGVLADLAGISQTKLSHIENGRVTPTLSELVSIATALRVPQQALMENFEIDFTEIERTDKIIDLLEELRTSAGKTQLVIDEVSNLTHELQVQVKQKIGAGSRWVLERAIVKGEIVLVITYTTTMDKGEIDLGTRYLRQDIQRLSSRLTEKDHHYRGLANILPGLVFNVNEDYLSATKYLKNRWNATEDPYVRALGGRDYVVAASHLLDRFEYNLAFQQVEHALSDDASLTLASRAKILQGLALAALNVGSKEGKNYLTSAEAFMTEAITSGDRHCYTQCQIVGTKLDYALIVEEPDGEYILQSVQDAANLLKAGPYPRGLNKLKAKMKKTEWRKLCESVFGDRK